MKYEVLSLFAIAIFVGCQPNSKVVEDDSAIEEASRPEYAIILHGGAGYRGQNDPQGDSIYKTHLQLVLDHGVGLLKNGQSAVDVVEQCLRMFEDDSLFNSGKGAVLNSDGNVELDASIMSGSDLQAGAVSSVKTTKHPISAARMVMDSSVHVFLSGAGADKFATNLGLEQVDAEYFVTRKRRNDFIESP